MNYLYHIAPENMKGDTLYPLNQLRETQVEIYEKQIKKYEGRRKILRRKIPFLNCLPSDVINLTAVHPIKLRRAFNEAEVPLKRLEWFKINPYDLDRNLAVVYLYKYPTWEEEGKTDNYTKFEPSQLFRYNEIPKKTIKYYSETFHKEKTRPFLFHLVPHILYKGTIDTRKCEVITV